MRPHGLLTVCACLRPSFVDPGCWDFLAADPNNGIIIRMDWEEATAHQLHIDCIGNKYAGFRAAGCRVRQQESNFQPSKAERIPPGVPAFQTCRLTLPQIPVKNYSVRRIVPSEGWRKCFTRAWSVPFDPPKQLSPRSGFILAASSRESPACLASPRLRPHSPFRPVENHQQSFHHPQQDHPMTLFRVREERA